MSREERKSKERGKEHRKEQRFSDKEQRSSDKDREQRRIKEAKRRQEKPKKVIYRFLMKPEPKEGRSLLVNFFYLEFLEHRLNFSSSAASQGLPFERTIIISIKNNS